MSLIHVLDPEISNKIAAGEVVERPASVVKELIENSIDAGATHITVEISNGGTTLIAVTDNGCGMASEDAEIAFLRHATSKIKVEEDLDAIYTLGFRGEALSSIGAVSKAAIYTKRPEDMFGTVVTCEGGEIIASEEGGMSDGTKIVVRNLFFNTPARMKFLKKDATEAGYITDIVSRFILSHPEISFRFIKNGKDTLISSGNGDLKNAVYAVYGKDYATSLINVKYENGNVSISGAVGKSNLARPNRNFQSFFVNGRYIKSPLIIKAVEEAFKNQIMIGKFPVAVLNIEINPAFIDINVHPTKLEVKFSDDKQIYDTVYYGVKNALYAIPDIPKMSVSESTPVHNPRNNPFIKKDESADLRNQLEIKPTTVTEVTEKATQPTEIPTKTVPEVVSTVSKEEIKPVDKPIFKEEITDSEKTESKPYISSEVKEDPLAAFRKKETEEIPLESLKFEAPEVKYKPTAPKTSEIKNDVKEKSITKAADEEKTVVIPAKKQNDNANVQIVGQIFSTYIIAQKGDEMLLIDQHAAHERIKYEQLLDSLESKKLYPQILLEPVIVKVSGEECSVFEQNSEFLSELGFESDLFGDNEIIIRTSPQDVEIGDVEDLYIELLSELSESKKEIISAKQQRLIYTIACKAAIKANHTLSFAEMETLVKNIISLENINTCPHGRPIIISMTKKELEKQFKRIV